MIAKYGCEMLLKYENIVLQSLQILYTFVLHAKIAIQKYTKLANVSHFTTFRNQTLQFY